MGQVLKISIYCMMFRPSWVLQGTHDCHLQDQEPSVPNQMQEVQQAVCWWDSEHPTHPPKWPQIRCQDQKPVAAHFNLPGHSMDTPWKTLQSWSLRRYGERMYSWDKEEKATGSTTSDLWHQRGWTWKTDLRTQPQMPEELHLVYWLV